MSKEKNVEIIKAFFEKDDWKYNYNEESSIFSTGVGGLDTNFESLKIYISIRDDYATSYTVAPIDTKEKNRMAVAEFITRANYGLVLGNFELDFDDGEVRYKMNVPSSQLENAENGIKDLLFVSLHMFEKYGDALLQVMIGAKSPKDAVEEAENSKEEK